MLTVKLSLKHALCFFFTTENCALVQMIEEIEVGGVPIGATIWRQIKPMIQGYIFYTPDTNATRKIIEKVRIVY